MTLDLNNVPNKPPPPSKPPRTPPPPTKPKGKEVLDDHEPALWRETEAYR
jgi:hypothetical protein